MVSTFVLFQNFFMNIQIKIYALIFPLSPRQKVAYPYHTNCFAPFFPLLVSTYVLKIFLYHKLTILSWQHSIPFHGYITIYLTSCLLIDIWIISFLFSITNNAAMNNLVHRSINTCESMSQG